MTTRVCILGTLHLLAVLLPATDSAARQGTVPLRLTLEEAQTRAIDASHRLAEARDREGAAQNAVTAERAATRPHVSVLAGYTRRARPEAGCFCIAMVVGPWVTLSTTEA